jgi:hypothetical protein
VADDDIGLRLLRDAPADAAEPVDIVAVHGIGAHPDDSWCKNVGTADNPRWVNWLTDESMLPAVAPQARIMRYGYQSQWFGEGAMRQKASTVAQRLLLALRRRREVGEATLVHSNLLLSFSGNPLSTDLVRGSLFWGSCSAKGKLPVETKEGVNRGAERSRHS